MINRKIIKKIFISAVISLNFSVPLVSGDKNVDRRKLLVRQQQQAAAVTAEQAKKDKDIGLKFQKVWKDVVEYTKSEFLTPIGAMYIYERFKEVLDWVRNIFANLVNAHVLIDVANALDRLRDTLTEMLAPIRKIPHQLRESVDKLSANINQLNNALVLIQKQKKDIEGLKLGENAGKKIVELAELEKLLLQSLTESENFLRLLLKTFTEIRDATGKIIDPVTNDVKRIEGEVNDLLGRVSSGAFGYPGLPARLRAIAKILIP